MRKLTSLTVVAPFYNEAANVRAFFDALKHVFEAHDSVIDFVFVDDGSSDTTLAELNALADADNRVTVLALSRNFGHQAALTAGLDHANGEAVVMMDSDLQHPPHEILRMIEAYERGIDIVYAVRNPPQNLGLLKRITADGFYGVINRMSDVYVVPGAADFRLMSRESVLALRNMREAHRFLRGMIPWMGYASDIIEYEQPERYAGEATYTLRKSLRLARHGLFSFSTIPLSLITWTGLALAGLATLYLIYILIVTVMGITVPGWSSVLVVTLVIGSVQLISLGVIAQYVGMMFEQVKARPLYLLKQQRTSAVYQQQQGNHDNP